MQVGDLDQGLSYHININETSSSSITNKQQQDDRNEREREREREREEKLLKIQEKFSKLAHDVTFDRYGGIFLEAKNIYKGSGLR